MSQGATKMHQKIDLRKRSRKESQKEGCAALSLDPICEHFPLKFDEKIEAKFDAVKVMTVHEKTMRKLGVLLLKFFEQLVVCEK